MIWNHFLIKMNHCVNMSMQNGFVFLSVSKSSGFVKEYLCIIIYFLIYLTCREANVPFITAFFAKMTEMQRILTLTINYAHEHGYKLFFVNKYLYFYIFHQPLLIITAFNEQENNVKST